jgi:hypothetical protein
MAVPPETQERIDLFDRARALLFERCYQAEDFAEALGVSLSTFSHLRTNLTAHSFSQRQAADALLTRFFVFAYRQLKTTPDQGSTAATARHTLGKHLRAVLLKDEISE